MSKNELLDAVINADKDDGKQSESKSLSGFKRRTSPVMDDKERASDEAVYWVPTNQCAPWVEHDRGNDWFNEQNCHDLIDSIKQKKDQIMAGLIRVIPEGKYPAGHALHGLKYEIIYGARRHFACKHNGLDVYLAKICDYDDKKCLALMHIENAQRKDISKMERARSIAKAFSNHWSEGGTSYQKMAALYKESKTVIYEYEMAGRLFFIEEISSCFDDLFKVPKTSAMKISAYWESSKEIVEGVLEALKQDKIFPSLSESRKARFILEAIKESDGDKKDVYISRQSEFKEQSIGIIKSKVNEDGMITIQLPPSAAKVNKKFYAELIERVMKELGMR